MPLHSPAQVASVIVALGSMANGAAMVKAIVVSHPPASVTMRL